MATITGVERDEAQDVIASGTTAPNGSVRFVSLTGAVVATSIDSPSPKGEYRSEARAQVRVVRADGDGNWTMNLGNLNSGDYTLTVTDDEGNASESFTV